MLGSQVTERIRQTFADQFEPDGDGYLYRKDSNGPPIPVTALERDRYIANFNRFASYWAWGIFVCTIGLFISDAAYAVMTTAEVSAVSIYIGVGVIAAISLVLLHQAYNLPMRQLRGRGTIGQSRSRAEIKNRLFAKLTYGQLVALVGAAILLLIRVGRQKNFLSGWNIIWLVLAAAIVATACVQAFRKWRFESKKTPSG